MLRIEKLLQFYFQLQQIDWCDPDYICKLVSVWDCL